MISWLIRSKGGQGADRYNFKLWKTNNQYSKPNDIIGTYMAMIKWYQKNVRCREQNRWVDVCVCRRFVFHGIFITIKWISVWYEILMECRKIQHTCTRHLWKKNKRSLLFLLSATKLWLDLILVWNRVSFVLVKRSIDDVYDWRIMLQKYS